VRVLVACDWFLKYAVNQAIALDRAGADVSLLCRSHGLEFGRSTRERDELLARLNGIPVSMLPGRVSSPSATIAVIALQRTVRRWQPDVVHAHDNADPRLLAIVAGLTRVTTIHDPVPHPGQPALGRVERTVRRRWITGSAAVVVHGTPLVDELPAWMQKQRIAVIPHGTSVREEPLPLPSHPSVLLFGRLQPYKGVDVLVRAMERVWAARPEVILRIAGVGPAAAGVPSDPRIELRHEYVPEDQLESLFSEASVVVLPYIQASQSGVGALALGYGIPTIVSDVGALPEIALDKSFIVPSADDQTLARAILRHLDHDDVLRRAVLHFARERLSWDACARQWMLLYESLVTNGER